MAIATVEFIEVVDGGRQVVEETFVTTEFVVKIDGQKYSPVLTTEVEIENDGDTATATDQCGHTERDRVTDNGWAIRVNGIITASDRTGNLSLALMRDVIATASDLKIRTDVIEGRFEVSNVLVTQTSDLVSINTGDTDGDEQAFQFQLQLGESESE